MSRTAVIFPGQGAQSVGMGRDVMERSARAREVFDRANNALGFDLADICFNGPAERLNATDVSQPAIFVTSVAIWEAIQERSECRDAVHPDAAAGLSLGEYTALWLARSISFDDAVRLVYQRGQFLQHAAQTRKGGMVSVMGLDSEKLNAVLQEAAGKETLVAANFNSPGQVVISGDAAACDRSLAIIEKSGGRGISLRVAGAFHSPLMQSAVEKLRAALAQTAFETPGIPVVSNVTADYHQDPAEIRRLLESQVAEAIHWSESIDRLIRDGYDRFVEVGPGRVLTGLMRGINRQVKAINVSTFAAIEKLATDRPASNTE